MDKLFDFQNLEKTIYQRWLKAGYFSHRNDENTDENAGEHSAKKPFVFVMPPPNVTGRLHMGHALNGLIQDILARYHRMQGKDVVWVPGTDHAGIATQTVVKKMLDAKGVDYRALGRESFVEKVFEWKDRYGSFILDQIKSLGCSCDWSRLRFTMDENLCVSVTHAFCQLYQQGLIYRGKRMVNWCPIDRTALSDDEVETKEGGESGFLYDIAYPIVGEKSEYLIVSTTRPETMFGDTAVAVHPMDQRYQRFIGKKIALPFANREIPIIADQYVDKDFGTGCLKVTPAHDKNDFEIGLRHDLPVINVMDEGACLNENAPLPFRGMSREDGRKCVLKKLEELGLLRGKHHRMIPLGRSYRSKAVVEYRLSEQWFVKMKPLAAKTLKMVDEIHFYPASMKKVFLHWLENIEDWCISRQIWWGHQIPAWYHVETQQVLVGQSTPAEVLKNPDLWRRDEDVLDTWFSSALWPMSVLGWPQKTADFERYFPMNILSTAKDIIFFWVARMCLFSVHFEKKLPFRDVCIHPTIVDHHGKTMSKSKGNGIDPQKIINGATLEELKTPIFDAQPSDQEKLLREIEELFPKGFEALGCDALRYTLIHLFSAQQMMQLSMKDFEEIGRRFTVKLWNAARFCKMHIDNTPQGQRVDLSTLGEFYDRFPEMIWMELLLNEAEEKIIDIVEKFQFNSLSQEMYNIFWKDFCDWYIELVKARLGELDNTLEKRVLLFHLSFSLNRLLSFLHPVMPFITEEIKEKLGESYREKDFDFDGESLVVSPFSVKNEVFVKYCAKNNTKVQKVAEEIELLREIVTMIRAEKKKYQIPAKVAVKAYAFLPLEKESFVWLESCKKVMAFLTKCESLDFIDEKVKNQKENLDNVVKSAGERMEILLELQDADVTHLQKNHHGKEWKKVEQELLRLGERLENADFLAKAKPEFVVKEKKRFESLKQRLVSLENL